MHTELGCHSLLQGNLSDPEIEPRSPPLQADSVSFEPPGKPLLALLILFVLSHLEASNSMFWACLQSSTPTPLPSCLSFCTHLLLSWRRTGQPTPAQSRTRLKQLSMHACIGEGNGSPLQCSCLENPRDRGAWWAAAYGVSQSWT